MRLRLAERPIRRLLADCAGHDGGADDRSGSREVGPGDGGGAENEDARYRRAQAAAEGLEITAAGAYPQILTIQFFQRLGQEYPVFAD